MHLMIGDIVYHPPDIFVVKLELRAGVYQVEGRFSEANGGRGWHSVALVFSK